VAQPTEQERQPEHEQQVPEDRPGQRRLHDLDAVVEDQEDRDDQLGHVAERRVDQPADARPGVQGKLLRRAADQSRQRKDGRGRGQEYRQVGATGDLERDRDRHEHQQPIE